MKRLLVAAALAACIPASGADENTREVVVSRHGAWTAKATVDTFDDREIAWEAFHPQGRDGGVALTCREGDVLSFDAYADNMFVNSIGSVLKKDEPVRVRLKVDDYPIVETRGAYPNTLAISDGDVRKIMTELLDGNEARIRTQHGDEQHTFILSLAGFREAGAWALGKCGYVLKNRDDDEEEDE